MSGSIQTELLAHASAHMAWLDKLATGKIDPFTLAYRSVTNFSLSHQKVLHANTGLHGDAAGSLSFELNGLLHGDLITGTYLEVQFPRLKPKTGTPTTSVIPYSAAVPEVQFTATLPPVNVNTYAFQAQTNSSFTVSVDAQLQLNQDWMSANGGTAAFPFGHLSLQPTLYGDALVISQTSNGSGYPAPDTAAGEEDYTLEYTYFPGPNGDAEAGGPGTGLGTPGFSYSLVHNSLGNGELTLSFADSSALLAGIGSGYLGDENWDANYFTIQGGPSSFSGGTLPTVPTFSIVLRGTSSNFQMLASVALPSGMGVSHLGPFDAMTSGTVNVYDTTFSGNTNPVQTASVTWTQGVAEIPESTFITGGGPADMPSYVWGVCYAMIQEASLTIGGSHIESLHGDYMEMASELHGIPGKMLQESLFKIDGVTVKDLSVMSQRGMTCYIPLPFFFTKGPLCVLPIGRPLQKSGSLNSQKIQVSLTLRSLKEIAMSIPTGVETQGSSINGTSLPMCDDTDKELQWSDFKFGLYLATVLLDEMESAALASALKTYGYSALVTTVQPLVKSATGVCGITFDANGQVIQSKLSLRHPVKMLMWAIAHKDRASTGMSTSPAQSRFTGDVDTGNPRIFGDTYTGLPGWEPYHGTRSFLRNSLDTTTESATAKGIAGKVSTTADTNYWRNDGLGMCPALLGNRFDYRLSHSTLDAGGAPGVEELEPMKSFTLKLNNNAKWNEQLGNPSHNCPTYFRTVQPLSHCNRAPRKGVYCFSFADNASDPMPSGSCNFTKISNKDLTMTTNAPIPTSTSLLMYSEHHNIFTMDTTQGTVGMDHTV